MKTYWKNNSRSRWWSIYLFYTHSSCWRNFYSKVCKHMQIYCWDRCQPTIPLLDVSTHARRSWHTLGYRVRTSRFTPRQSKTRSFEIMVMSYFQRTRPDCKIESLYTTGRQQKFGRISVDGFSSHCNTVFEAMGCFDHFRRCQELRSSLSEEEIKRDIERRPRWLETRLLPDKGFTVIEKWQCEWGRLYKATTNVKLHFRENVPYRRSLTEHQLLDGTQKRNLFGHVQCDLEYAKIWKPSLLTSFHHSRTIELARMLLMTWRKRMPRKKNVSTWKNVDMNLQITKWNSDYSSAAAPSSTAAFFLPKYTVLLSIFQSIVSTASYIQQRTQEDKLTRIPIQE